MKDMNTASRNLVVIPFAYKKGAKSGASIKRKDDPVYIYLRNIFVSAVSCKKNNPDVDVAFVTNYDIDDSIIKLLSDNGIMIMKCPFDSFHFPDSYQWCLAFYKLCVLKFTTNLNYQNILCIDSDTYIQGNFDYLWNNLGNSVVLYDRTGSTMEPLGSLKHLDFVRMMYKNRIQRVGGEFVASDIETLKVFIAKAEEIFQTMVDEKIDVLSGDEYITSMTAACFHNIDFSGERYIFRFETGFWRDICNKGQIGVTPILHVPGSKKNGMIKLFNYYVKKGDFPPIKKIYAWFHFNRRTFKQFIKSIIKGTLFRN